MPNPTHANKSLNAAQGSALQKYQALVVGSQSIGFLIRFELTLLLCGSMPGALGLFLRKFLFPGLLGSCGRGVVFGNNLTLRHPRKIHIGDDCVIDDNCMLDAKGDSNQGIHLGDGCFIGRNTILSCKNGDIFLEDGVNFGFNCEIFSGCKVTVGAHTVIGAYSYLVGGEGYDMTDTGIPMAHQALPHAGTELYLGGGSWLGTHVVILNGVTIGEGAVIAASAVVTKDIEPNSINGGVPSKQLGMRPVAEEPTPDEPLRSTG